MVETPSIYGDLTAEENIREQYMILGMPSFDGVKEVLRLVGLENTGKKKAKNFSLGMKQRLGIAIALCGDPDLLILDEPVNGLDFQSTEFLYQIMGGYKQYGTLLFSSHILESICLTSDRVLVLEHGRISQTFTGAEIAAGNIREVLADEEHH